MASVAPGCAAMTLGVCVCVRQLHSQLVTQHNEALLRTEDFCQHQLSDDCFCFKVVMHLLPGQEGQLWTLARCPSCSCVHLHPWKGSAIMRVHAPSGKSDSPASDVEQPEIW